MPTFSPLVTPDFSAQYTISPIVRSAKFGDGYEQRQGMGMNTVAKVWDLTFTDVTGTEADSITGFLVTQAGVTSFTWTDPEGNTAKYKCSSWLRQLVFANVYTVTCKFMQVFEP